MANNRHPKVVDNVHFVWVPSYYVEGHGPFGSYWLSMNQPSIVHVKEPKEGEEEWCVLLYKTGTYCQIYVGTEKISFQKAAQHARDR